MIPNFYSSAYYYIILYYIRKTTQHLGKNIKNNPIKWPNRLNTALGFKKNNPAFFSSILYYIILYYIILYCYFIILSQKLLFDCTWNTLNNV